MRVKALIIVFLFPSCYLFPQQINDNCHNSIEINGQPFNQFDSIHSWGFCNGMAFEFTSILCEAYYTIEFQELTSSNIGSNNCTGISESTNLNYVDTWYKKALDYPYHTFGCPLVIDVSDTIHISFYYGTCDNLYQNKCFTLEPGLYDGRTDFTYWISQGIINEDDSLYIQLSYNPNTLSERPYAFIAIQHPILTWGYYYNETYDRPAIIQQTTSVEPAESNNILIYPNPTSDILKIKTHNDIALIRVFNSIGNPIIKMDKLDSNQNIDVSQFENGIYLIYIKLKNGQELVEQFYLMSSHN